MTRAGAWPRPPRPGGNAGVACLVVAHRGHSVAAPENTCAAIRAARAADADAVEIDVRRCGTGEIVVFHDAGLARLLGRPARIADLPFAALRELELAPGVRIPTLDEALDALGSDLLIDIEIKAEQARDVGLERALAAVLRRRRLGARALVSSFHPVALWRFRRLMPEQPAGLIFGERQARPLREAWAARVLRPAVLAAQASLCDAAAVAAWHRQGCAVLAWTVEDPREAAALWAIGVDAIAANDPARLREALAAAAR